MERSPDAIWSDASATTRTRAAIRELTTEATIAATSSETAAGEEEIPQAVGAEVLGLEKTIAAVRLPLVGDVGTAAKATWLCTPEIAWSARQAASLPSM